ncbi:hypothetical protein F4861DRAFT_273397 [Xylaria intraflava]|nr:hypothetical protein F4861DRAFT_273397 [Xylaria intraflava]
MPPLPPPSSVPPPSLFSHHPPRLRNPIPSSESPQPLGSRALEGAQTVPQGYGNEPFGPSPGVVVGIVLGSVAGFLLVFAAFYWCVNIGQNSLTIDAISVGGGATASSVVSRHRRPSGPPRRHHRRSRHSPRHEKVELRRERPIPVRLERDEEIVVQEYRRSPRPRSRSVSRPPPPPRSVTSDGDDVIIVEEDHSPPRRRADSPRSQRTRASSFRDEIRVRAVSRQRSVSRA